ncbi:MAG: hypothetical protein J6D37_04850 [Clostridia bacterium]|nr:hypothetical protein [Clostridia bacterium]
MKSKQRLLIQIGATLAIVICFGVILALTFHSLLKKSKLLEAESTLRTAAVSVLLYEGLEEEFSGYLVYYADAMDADGAFYRDTVAYAKINEKSAVLLAEEEVELNVIFAEDNSFLQDFSGYSKVAGIGATELLNADLHDTLLSYQVVYYRLMPQE